MHLWLVINIRTTNVRAYIILFSLWNIKAKTTCVFLGSQTMHFRLCEPCCLTLSFLVAQNIGAGVAYWRQTMEAYATSSIMSGGPF